MYIESAAHEIVCMGVGWRPDGTGTETSTRSLLPALSGLPVGPLQSVGGGYGGLCTPLTYNQA